MYINLKVELRDGTTFDVDNDGLTIGGNPLYNAKEFRKDVDALVADIERKLIRLYGDIREREN